MSAGLGGVVRADPLTLTSIFGKDVRYVVPMFQRPYVWNMTKQWEPLWEDIKSVTERLQDATEEAARTGVHVPVPPHFLGAIVLEQMQTPTGSIETRSVIDGQQRLTTLQIFIAAAREIAESRGMDQQARLLGKFLRNDPDLVSDPDFEFKVWPTNADREAFRAVMRKEPPSSFSSATSLKIVTAMQYFRSVLESWVRDTSEKADCEARFSALTTVLRQHMKIVAIDLDLEDNAQVIFETLNARGTPLQAADLIKNVLFQMADREGASVDALYLRYWAPFDRDSWRREIRQGRLMRPALDVFLGHWLAMVKKNETPVHQLFPDFRNYVSEARIPASQIVFDLARSAGIYLEMQKYPLRSTEGQFFYRQNLMETTTTIPLLLFIFGLAEEEFPASRRHRVLRAIDSYLVRRMLCRFTTKGYNRIFLDLLGEAKKRPAQADEVVLQVLSRQQGESQAWPTDAQVRQSVNGTPLYTALPRNRLRFVLEAIEQRMRTELSEQWQPDDVLTIEHLLPQDWKANWPLSPSADPEVAVLFRDRIKHTLGNLTLVTGKLNPLLSNGPWVAKKGALRDHSVLRLNWRLLKDDPQEWTEKAIEARTGALADVILEIWPAPGSPSWARSSTSESGVVFADPHPDLSELTPEDEPPQTDAELVRMVIDTRLPVGPGRMLAEALLGELQSWPGVVPKIGKSERTEDGLPNYVMLQRQKSGVGAFLYVRPKRDHVRLDFRLPREYVEGREHAYAREVKASNVYQVSMELDSLDDLPEALDLGRAAFDNAS